VFTSNSAHVLFINGQAAILPEVRAIMFFVLLRKESR